jgi:hypothetical protein
LAAAGFLSSAGVTVSATEVRQLLDNEISKNKRMQFQTLTINLVCCPAICHVGHVTLEHLVTLPVRVVAFVEGGCLDVCDAKIFRCHRQAGNHTLAFRMGCLFSGLAKSHGVASLTRNG